MNDVGFDNHVGRAADHDQMLDIVAPEQDDPPASVDRRSIDDGEAAPTSPRGPRAGADRKERRQESMNAEIIDRLERSYVNEYIELALADTATRFVRIIEERLKGIEEMIDKRLPVDSRSGYLRVRWSGEKQHDQHQQRRNEKGQQRPADESKPAPSGIEARQHARGHVGYDGKGNHDVALPPTNLAAKRAQRVNRRGVRTPIGAPTY
jgi:hypothetical protein